MSLLIIIAASLLVGFGGGWTVKNWKDGAHVATLESRDAVLTAANNKCSGDIDSVRESVRKTVEFYERRMAAAKVETEKMKSVAEKHSQAAAVIAALPRRGDETLCQAVEREQIEYVESRHADR